MPYFLRHFVYRVALLSRSFFFRFVSFFRFVVHTSSLYMFRTWSCFFVYRFAFNVLFSSGFCSSCPAFSQRASLSSCFIHRDFLRFILHWIVFYMFCIWYFRFISRFWRSFYYTVSYFPESFVHRVSFFSFCFISYTFRLSCFLLLDFVRHLLFPYNTFLNSPYRVSWIDRATVQL